MLEVSYSGRIGSFSHEAAMQIFPNAHYNSYNTFVEAIHSVQNGKSQYAIIPIENSTAGRVAEIHNILPTLNLFITHEKIIRISHNLYTNNQSNTIEDIKTVISHPQALMQCSIFLENLRATQSNAANTAIAAEELSKSGEQNTAVICSKTAGDFYNLHLLKENIHNQGDNSTTFIAVSKEQNIQTFQNPLTSIIFSIPNKAGGVYEALGCFAKNNINLVKIESYIPTGINTHKAQFFLTFQGCIQQEAVAKSIKELTNLCGGINYLGTYEADIKRFPIS